MSDVEGPDDYDDLGGETFTGQHDDEEDVEAEPHPDPDDEAGW